MKIRNYVLIPILILTLIFIRTNPKNIVHADMSSDPAPLIILYTNDTHGRAAENETVGLSGVSALKKKYEALGADVLLLDTGDTVHGVPFATLRKGSDIVTLMNAAGYDAMVPGDHDFDYGLTRLGKLQQEMNFPLLAANLMTEGTSIPIFKSAKVIEKGNHKIGVFGLITPNGNKRNVTGCQVKDCIETAREMVAFLQEQNVDRIIALGHLGTDDANGVTSEQVIAAVPGIDLFIDGHSHSAFPEGKQINDTLLVSAGENFDQIGVVTIDQAAMKASLVSSDQLIEEELRDPKIDLLIRKINLEHLNLLDVVVAGTAIDLDNGNDHFGWTESTLGNLTADAMTEYTKADLAFVSSDCIAAKISAGPITKEQIQEAYPSGEYVMTLEVSGSMILNALEHAAALPPEGKKKYLQVSGISLTYDPGGTTGNKITRVRIHGEPMVMNQTYILATNQSMLCMKGGYPMFAGKIPMAEYTTIEEIVSAYLMDQKNILAVSEGRILRDSKEYELIEETVD